MTTDATDAAGGRIQTSGPLAASRTWQVVLVLAAWTFVCALHWNNDGLWLQGDSSRHAANGIFWKDYIRSLPADPRDYALRYYARYPVTHLTSYPPLFHLIEAGLFAVFGPSSQLAKRAVLCFALLAALYATAWLRRFVQPEAGWAGALLLLQPGMVKWSNAVLLNVPAFALMLGGLYHSRRWLESGDSRSPRQLRAAGVLFLLAVFVYYPAGVAAIIVLAWMLVERQWKMLWSRKAMFAGAAGVVLFLPSLYVMARWAPRVGRWLSPVDLFRTERWLYYPRLITSLANVQTLLLAAVGLAAGLTWHHRRRGTAALLAWLATSYVVFTYIDVKEDRYILPLLAPLLFLCATALAAASHWLGRRLVVPAGTILFAAIAGLISLQIVEAYNTRIPEVSGFREVASYLADVAPNETILYEGDYDGVLMFYMLAGDPGLQRGVVLGRKVLGDAGNRWREGAPVSASDVRNAVRARSGSRWIVIEDSGGRGDELAGRLMEAAQSPEIEHVRSFAITARTQGWVHVFRWREPIDRREYLDIAFPDLGTGVHYKLAPIEPRTPTGQQPDGARP